MRWPNARRLQLPRGEYELLGEGKPCAHADGVAWYWCALRKVGGWRIYSGVIRVAPDQAGMDELEAELREMVERITW